jgi:uncharacterized membrane protein
MQKSFPYSPRQNIDQDSFLSRKSFYIAALVAATMTVMIGFTLADMKYGASTSSSSSSPSEFSSGMPLP